MTAPRDEVTGLDDRFCRICRGIGPVDAEGWCAVCYREFIRDINDRRDHEEEESF